MESIRRLRCAMWPCWEVGEMGRVQANNLLGKRFGRLVVLSRNGSSRGNAVWRCMCDCGSECLSLSHNLTSSKKKSCGCLPRQLAAEAKARKKHKKTNSPGRKVGRPTGAANTIVVGNVYGILTVNCRQQKAPGCVGVLWNCTCACGEKVSIPTRKLRLPLASCGCAIAGYNEAIIEMGPGRSPIGISHETVRKRIRYGWSREAALLTPLRPSRWSKRKVTDADQDLQRQ